MRISLIGPTVPYLVKFLKPSDRTKDSLRRSCSIAFFDIPIQEEITLGETWMYSCRMFPVMTAVNTERSTPILRKVLSSINHRFGTRYKLSGKSIELSTASSVTSLRLSSQKDNRFRYLRGPKADIIASTVLNPSVFISAAN